MMRRLAGLFREILACWTYRPERHYMRGRPSGKTRLR
jgi:hypothetical protein